MKIAKTFLGLVVAVTLLAGGFIAGTFISQTRAFSFPAQQFSQPSVPQQQFQVTVIPPQSQTTPIPQNTPPVVPPQAQWGLGGWMMNPQGEWEHGWMMDPNYVQQGQPGWNMHDWNNGYQGGMHGGMMGGYAWQIHPNWNATPSVPNNPSYPTSSSPVSFKDDVQPIFAARCAACHGGTNGLYLDTYENVLNGGINGAVVLPSDVYNSRLAYYVYSGYMPFRNTPLTSTEVKTILDWIAQGALDN